MNHPPIHLFFHYFKGLVILKSKWFIIKDLLFLRKCLLRSFKPNWHWNFTFIICVSAEVIRRLKSEISNQKIHLQQLQLEKLTDRAIIETLKSKLTIMLHLEDNSEGKMSRCGTDPLPEAPDCMTDSSMSSSGHPITQPQCDDNLNDCGQTLRAISRFSSESSNEGFELVPREQNEQQRDLIASQVGFKVNITVPGFFLLTEITVYVKI